MKTIAIAFHNWMRKNDTEENAETYFHYTDEDMYNVFIEEYNTLNKVASSQPIIKRLQQLAKSMKEMSDKTIPLPKEPSQRYLQQGKQEAYANCYFELKNILDAL